MMMNSAIEAVTVLERPKISPNIVGDTIFFDRQECLELGRELHETYVENKPYPHIVLDDFLPTTALRRVISEFPTRRDGRFSDAHSKLKTGYQMEAIESPYITNLLNALNSSQFLGFLEEMTGIKGLIPDPHFLGGGLHETKRGGHLSVHVDFNIHRPLNLRRRLNLILFLNELWSDEFGGQLELWDKNMKACQKAVSPIMGRAIVFNTDPGSYHGHPDPLNAPEDRYRRSIALYYYTAPEDGSLPAAHSTQFVARPGSHDAKRSVSVRARELLRECVPPILLRMLRKRSRL